MPPETQQPLQLRAGGGAIIAALTDMSAAMALPATSIAPAINALVTKVFFMTSPS
jgi:hypothetical protein